MEFPKPPVMVLCSASALFSAPPETVANSLGSASLLNPPLIVQKSPNAELFKPLAMTLNFPVKSTVGNKLGKSLGVVEGILVSAALGLEEGVAEGAALGIEEGTGWQTVQRLDL